MKIHTAVTPTRFIVASIDEICRYVICSDFTLKQLEKWKQYLNEYFELLGHENIVGRVRCKLALASLVGDLIGDVCGDSNSSGYAPYHALTHTYIENEQTWIDLEQKMKGVRAMILLKDASSYPGVLPGLMERMIHVEEKPPLWKEDGGKREELSSLDVFNKDYHRIISLLRFQRIMTLLNVEEEAEEDGQPKKACRAYIKEHCEDHELRRMISHVFDIDETLGFKRAVEDSKLTLIESRLKGSMKLDVFVREARSLLQRWYQVSFPNHVQISPMENVTENANVTHFDMDNDEQQQAESQRKRRWDTVVEESQQVARSINNATMESDQTVNPQVEDECEVQQSGQGRKSNEYESALPNSASDYVVVNSHAAQTAGAPNQNNADEETLPPTFGITLSEIPDRANFRPLREGRQNIDMGDKTRRRSRFTPDERTAIIYGVQKFGVGKWSQIKKEYPNILQNRSNVQIKDGYRTIAKDKEKGKEIPLTW